MIVVPNGFGIRQGDHFYITEDGPSWFTQPSNFVGQPFLSVVSQLNKKPGVLKPGCQARSSPDKE